ncbi:methenyltetrahydrofolate synthase domain-containing protein [Nasonia vitripennis]|uniref:Methenyltetrahydrofolate synthase domain-containing protein n=1 Tax=Nasonia vitripennis TaxID=7425 RepID=A0A7M7GHC4_NASVI|nr:methenyltetrahydrofolate synthase domain-containing protein [Nasonia vitripennis]
MSENKEESPAKKPETTVATTADNPAETPAENPEKVPAETAAEIPAKAPAETPAENPAKALSETPTESPVKAPAETPAKTSEETPAKTSEETPAKTSEETPAKTSEETPAKTSEETPAKTSEETPAKTSEETPAKTSEETPAKTPAEAPAVLKTKQDFRKKVWCHMAEKRLSNSFRSLCSRTPFFKRATEATKRLCELEELKKSKLLMISPDKFVILLPLKKEKEILIPTPRLFNGLFSHIKNAAGLPEEESKNVITRNNIKQIESPVNFDTTTDLKVDMLILGSVCVNRAGYRIGDGAGFADLEYAILSKMKAVNEKTTVVTLVHDCQILDDLPNELFEPHDVPVDIIITPTQTIFVNPRLPKPTEIIWPAISKRRLAGMPVLGEIKQFVEKEGKVVTLKEEDSDEESRSKERIRVKKMISELQQKYRRSRSRPNSGIKENGTTEKDRDVRRRPYLRKRRLRKARDNNDENNDSENKSTENRTNAKIPRPARRFTPRNHVDFSLRLSNIASTVRVRDLKNALIERGVKPTNITWRGQKGFCYLHFGKLRNKSISPEEQQPVQVDSIVANLRQLKIGEAPPAGENGFIVVEPAEPVTRIEVTDVSAV